ncbi:uncharacterized protein LOC113790427 [Dermatophagoides pteronyssinus]|uniref:uncharacterized protein LOC113790427 n=1 Tax=Dermatophagoides pteronyssinus TaxID=6956 RepID=UPI003F678833
MTLIKRNHLLLWPLMVTIILVCYLSSTVFARNYYPPKYEDNRQSRIKLNLGLHVPPIIVKLPRMEMPQLVIGANLIKNPKAKPLVLNMPPPPSISFGDSKYDGGGYSAPPSYGGGYQYAGSTQTTDSIKTSASSANEYGLDLKAYSSDQYQNMMHPSASVAQPPPLSPLPPPPSSPLEMMQQYPSHQPQYSSHQPHYAHPHHHHYGMMPPPPPPPSSHYLHHQHEQQSDHHEPKPMPPPMMPPPPLPPMGNPMHSYPGQQPPYYGTTLESMPHYPVERMGLIPPPPPPPHHSFSMKPFNEPGMMAMSTNRAQQHLLPPPSGFKSPFQLLKNSGNEEFKLRLKPNAEIFDSEQLYSSINGDDEQQDNDDSINEDYSKDYNAAPKISMPKYQQRN